MIKFFSRIRKSLLAENKFSKYMLYAIGEIILVVIGILIALQINNYKESRIDDKLAIQYLKGIKSDLNKDLIEIDAILLEQTRTIAIINSIDSILNNKTHQINKYKNILREVDTLNFKSIFYRGLSFRSTSATYSSLVSDGKSGLIKNRALFERIKRIYDIRHQRINSIYETLKDRDELINWAYPSEKKNWNYSDLKSAKDEKIFLDLSNFTETKYFYCQHLSDLKILTNSIILLIDKELEN